MLNSLVIAAIVFVSVLFTPKVLKLQKQWHTVLATAVVAAALVAVWEAVRAM